MKKCSWLAMLASLCLGAQTVNAQEPVETASEQSPVYQPVSWNEECQNQECQPTVECSDTSKMFTPYVAYDQLFLKYHDSAGVGLPALALTGSFGYEPAYRLTAGTGLGKNAYAEVRYMDFDDETTLNPSVPILPIPPIGMEVDIRNFDLAIGYRFDLDYGISARVETGFRYLDYSQNLALPGVIAYESESESIGAFLAGNVSKQLVGGLSVYSKALIGNLLGDSDENLTAPILGPGANISIPTNDISTMVLEYGAGLRYDYELTSGPVFTFQAGFENTTYFGLNRGISLLGIGEDSDISLFGAQLRAGVSY